MKSFQSRRLSLRFAAACTGLMLVAASTGCSTTSSAAPDAAGRMPACVPGAPVTAAIIQDLGVPGASAGQRLSPADVEPLLPVLACRGGEIAVAVIDGRDQPLLRLRLEPAPTPPPSPAPNGNVVAGRQDRDDYREAVSRWQADKDRWQSEADRAVMAFKRGLTDLLARAPQDDPDVWAVVRRAGDFFNEQRDGEPAAPAPVLVFISQRERVVLKCRDIRGDRVIEPGESFTDDRTGITWVCAPDGEWKNAANLPRDGGAVRPGPTVLPVDPRVRVVAVKGAGGPGPLDELQPAKFEQPAPALGHAAKLLSAR